MQKTGKKPGEKATMRIQCDLYSCEKVYDAAKSISRLRSGDTFDICFVVSGAGTHCVLNQEIPCKKGDICIVPPNVPHRHFLADADGNLTVRVLRFRLSDWFAGDIADEQKSQYCYGVFNANATIAYAMLNGQMQERVNALFDYIESETAEQKCGWDELVRGYLTNLLLSIKRYIDSAVKDVTFATPKEWRTVSSVIRIVKEESGNDTLTLKEIAERLHFSQSQLSRSFKKVTGKSFADYLREVRLKAVCRMLESSNERVEDIAKRCGFRDIPTFYKVFSAYFNTTPNQYRLSVNQADTSSVTDNKSSKGEKLMSILNEISENLQNGKAKIVKELVQQAIDEGGSPETILNEGLLSGMGIIGEKFKNGEAFVPEVLVAARAMNMGAQILKPYLAANGVQAKGKVCIGTVQGDLHDIGKNLVKMMLEGKGLEVIDLGTDVPAETFVKTAVEENCQIICCSALLTTTMPVMGEVVKAAEAAGVRDKVKIMVGGAPVTEEFCKQIGADCYTTDAASASDAAVAFCQA